MPSTKNPTTPKAAKKTASAVKKAAVKKTAVKKAAQKTAATPAAKVATKAARKTAPAVAPNGVPPNWLTAARAADAKKATNIKVLDLRDITSFADFFLICSAANQRQIHAIANDIEVELKKQGERPNSVEGYRNAEWVLMDYGDLVIHIFSDQARAYYDLDRLWRDGKEVPLAL